jgi:hypothetical protein
MLLKQKDRLPAVFPKPAKGFSLQPPVQQRPSSASYASLNNATLAELLDTCEFSASLNDETAKEKEGGDYQANCREIKYEVTWTRVGQTRNHEAGKPN